MRHLALRLPLWFWLGLWVWPAASLVHAQPSPTPNEFLSVAVPLARASQRETGIPASVKLAQAILETGWGRSPIGEAKNYFGIKAALNPDGTVNIGKVAIGWVWASTREWDGTRYVEVRARFRKYASLSDSFHDHSLLLLENPRYAQALRHTADPDEFARQIALAGYATSPTYAQDLIDLMRKHDLYQFDLRQEDADLSGRSDYATVEPGQAFELWAELYNSGATLWAPEAGYALVNTNGVALNAPMRLDLPASVRPGGVVRFVLPMVAPAEVGVYATRWRLMHGTQSLGPDILFMVTVRAATKPPPSLLPWLLSGLALSAIAGLIVYRRRQMRNRRRRRPAGPPESLP